MALLKVLKLPNEVARLLVVPVLPLRRNWDIRWFHPSMRRAWHHGKNKKSYPKLEIKKTINTYLI